MMVTVTNRGDNERVIKDTRGVYITIPPGKTRIFSMPAGHIERFQNAPRPRCKLDVEINAVQPPPAEVRPQRQRTQLGPNPKPTTLAIAELAGSDDSHDIAALRPASEILEEQGNAELQHSAALAEQAEADEAAAQGRPRAGRRNR